MLSSPPPSLPLSEPLSPPSSLPHAVSAAEAVRTIAARAIGRRVWNFILGLPFGFLTPADAAFGVGLDSGGVAALRGNLDEVHARTLGRITEATSSRPTMMLVTLTVTLSRRRALEMTPISRTPARTPCSRPRPPKIETPPSRTAAITWSS